MVETKQTPGSGTHEFVERESRKAYDIHQLVREGIDIETASEAPAANRCWREMREIGTELWLDTGDIDAVTPLWNRLFTGLTTNNTLLNAEVQKGAYDELIPRAAKILGGLPEQQRVREIAFVLNTRHALRLVERFGCRVSVELHTDVACDCDASVSYARRCHEICPEHFVVKIPFTPDGLIATRKLRDEGVAVNCTLGCSARQNYVATALSNPSFVNVFLGRLNAYVADNRLGDGRRVGEKATLASQQEVKVFARGLPQSETRQIAASLRDAEQIANLAGVDIMTLPPHVAQDALEHYDDPWRSHVEEDYPIDLAPDTDAEVIRLDTLWSVAAEERKFVERMILQPPGSGADLIQAARDFGIADLFPQLSSDELQMVAADGKIPRHDRWGDKIMRRQLAIDSLMTWAGLQQFAASQAELDHRIRRLMT